MKIQLYQRVALTQDMPEHNLLKGDVAVVVEHLPSAKNGREEEGYALEVFNALGETIDVIIVSASTVKPFMEDEILHVRSLTPKPLAKSEAVVS